MISRYKCTKIAAELVCKNNLPLKWSTLPLKFARCHDIAEILLKLV